MRQRLQVLALTVAALGCATTAEHVPIAETIDLSSFRVIGELGSGPPGKWLKGANGAVVNDTTRTAPSDSAPDAPEAPSVSLALLDGFRARDMVVEASVGFTGLGAPSVVFRVQEQDGVAVSMYAVALHRGGVNLWLMEEGRWYCLHRRELPVAPGMAHCLRVTGERDRITVGLDGGILFEVRGTSLMESGGAGICGREGQCMFYAFGAKAL
ncbi:MAG TPA: hypothetical protein HPP77_06880 [Candidatus Hydrogenedentes bacterium]|nr:hypothetical protein [Candidatus Hydrogenedentota bacterium]